MAQSGSVFAGSEVGEAQSFVDSVMCSQVLTAVNSPFHVLSGRKRHLSMPDDKSVKKSKGNSVSDREHLVAARRSLYTNHITVESKPETEMKATIGKNDKQRKIFGIERQSETGNTDPQMNDNVAELLRSFRRMETRYTSFEKSLDKKFTEIEKDLQSKIDRVENQVVKKFTTIVNTAVATLKEELGEELDDLSERVKSVEEREQKRQDCACKNSNTDLNIVVRNLAQREGENIVREVNGLLKDGLGLRDVLVEDVQRKQTAQETGTGVVIAKCKSDQDKQSIMKAKTKLRSSRKYDKVFIENDLPRHQLIMNANIRNIVNSIGRDKLQIRGSRVEPIRHTPVNRSDHGYTNGGSSHGQFRSADRRHDNRRGGNTVSRGDNHYENPRHRPSARDSDRRDSTEARSHQRNEGQQARTRVDRRGRGGRDGRQ